MRIRCANPRPSRLALLTPAQGRLAGALRSRSIAARRPSWLQAPGRGRRFDQGVVVRRVLKAAWPGR
jgi:hypothetical protein